MIKELVLKKPIMAHNEKLHVLELREPSYDEIEAIGFPFTVSG
ncbi:phage tail assembly protein, partial [Salmonella enterica subsp. enterica serovar Anatum]|nr:phage tail assembly protein [Salmonella enterica subsp. enterica]ECT5978747.1 phage tail assembly protein [Salmonella enterica subsp. enterica serovar Anatum]EGI3747818.1 phage tail assembly protein [Salmonella enterica]MER15472.1 phage tail assembly protein [Salmonella enterica]